jgi:hypothetical protein
MCKIGVGCLLLLLWEQAAMAGSLVDEGKAYCEKIKQCAKARMSPENMRGMPEGMEAMMKQALDSMCMGVMQKAEKAREHQELHQLAAACFKSKAQQSCDKLKDDTPECIAFKKQAKKYKR